MNHEPPFSWFMLTILQGAQASSNRRLGFSIMGAFMQEKRVTGPFLLLA